MKLTKCQMNKTGIVVWVDAVGYTNESLAEVKKKGLCLKEIIGTIIYIGKINYKDCIIVRTEEHIGDESGDYTVLPGKWVVDFKEMEIK